MVNDIINYLNAKITAVGYFDEVLCLAEKIKRGEDVYPALYNGNNEYVSIDFDKQGSISYWRKNGNVTIDNQDNVTTANGVQYNTTIPLKLVCFIKKESNSNNTQYFADNIALSLISNLTTNTSALKTAMKAKKVSIIANGYNTEAISVGSEEYDNINFEAKYTHAFFSIDFTVSIITNNQCYSDICDDLPINFGYVTIKDSNGDVIAEVLCGGEYTCTGGTCLDATVENSDQTYTDTVASGGTLVLPDTTYNIYVNGVLDQSFSVPTLKDETININP